MKTLFLSLLLSLLFGYQNVYSQCDFVIPPAVKKIEHAKREITFSEVTINGVRSTYLDVGRGENVRIKTRIESRKMADYCPGCIVQIYWGIKGHTSVCAKSFGGYSFTKRKSTHEFKAPTQDGIYYITMGGTLEYSCKNNVERPSCSPNDAFAVIKVGNPGIGKKVTLNKVNKSSSEYLKTTLVSTDCFGNLDKIEWFLNGRKLAYDNQQEIPLGSYGRYKVVWSNCAGSISKSFTHNGTNDTADEDKGVGIIEIATNDNNTNTGIEVVEISTNDNENNTTDTGIEIVEISVGGESEETVKKEKDIADLVKTSDKFVLEHLIFDLGKSDIKPEAAQELDKLAQVMKDNPAMKIVLEGHTDYRGSAKKNQKLSEERVKSAKAYLVSQGINSENIRTIGWGEKKPLIVTKDVQKAAINRRVEVRILSR